VEEDLRTYIEREECRLVNSILGPGRPVFETQVEFEVSSEKGTAKHYGRRGLKRFLSRKRNDRNALGSNEQCHLLVNRGRLGRARGMDEPNTWHFEQDGISIRLPAHCAPGIGGAEKFRHELVHRASINLFRSSELEKGASVNERKPVSQGKRLILVMNYKNGSDAGKVLNPLEISLRISSRSFLSSALSGLSRSRTAGLITNARAKATRCCWPRDNCAMRF